jgi:hypothetical protein
MTVKGGYGALTFSKGNLDADVHAVMASSKDATAMVTSTNKQLEGMRKNPPLPAIGTMVRALTLTPVNDEVVAKLNVAEKDLLSLLALAFTSLGSP